MHKNVYLESVMDLHEMVLIRNRDQTRLYSDIQFQKKSATYEHGSTGTPGFMYALMFVLNLASLLFVILLRQNPSRTLPKKFIYKHNIMASYYSDYYSN